MLRDTCLYLLFPCIDLKRGSFSFCRKAARGEAVNLTLAFRLMKTNSKHRLLTQNQMCHSYRRGSIKHPGNGLLKPEILQGGRENRELITGEGLFANSNAKDENGGGLIRLPHILRSQGISHY